VMELPIVADLVTALRSLWHRVGGHPRPYHYTIEGTYCAGCGERIRTF